MRRAGLDYWRYVDPVVWPDWARFEEGLSDADLGAPYFFSAEGTLGLWDVDLRPATMLVFGRESHGLPAEVRERYRSRLVRIPMAEGPVRSLNVSTAAAIALFEALRQRRSC